MSISDVEFFLINMYQNLTKIISDYQNYQDVDDKKFSEYAMKNYIEANKMREQIEKRMQHESKEDQIKLSLVLSEIDQYISTLKEAILSQLEN